MDEDAAGRERRYQLRTTFDTVANHYDSARPGYPEELFDDIVSLSGLPDNGRVLEIGCGSGVATAPMARRGYRMHCVEHGEELAVEARRNLATFPNVLVDAGAFEDFPLEQTSYDLVMAATSFHWLDQPAGYLKTAEILKPGGSFAMFRHLHVKSSQDDSFFEAVQDVYRQAGMRGDFVLQDHSAFAGQSDEIEATGLFGPVKVRRYVWDKDYDAAGYIRLLSTFSDNLALPAETRAMLFDGIVDMIDGQFGGRIVKGYLVILHVAPVRQVSELFTD